MKKLTPVRLLSLLAGAVALPTPALAHTAQSLVYDCASGLAHPLHGWDHVLAMIAVGVLAAQYGGHARWLLPIAFVGVMSCAAVLGTGDPALPAVETMIATSVLVFGLIIAAAVRLPLPATALIIALFAIAHGIAHGAAMPANATALPYAAGFVLSTVALHALGLLLGQLTRRESSALPRFAGAACAAAGAFLLIAPAT